MDSDWAFYICVTILIIFTAGTPDLLDAIIQRISNG